MNISKDDLKSTYINDKEKFFKLSYEIISFCISRNFNSYSKEDKDDFIQESVLVLLKDYNKINPEKNIMSLIFHITSKRTLQIIRKENKRNEIVTILPLDTMNL